ncbi:hypothetical protein F0562_011258 [Nyssa sinensis]|uniref:Uncharacterized protein n=1 Tax=Nyssa sinensis TaxID=561372 RepID=A0A5J5A160_9ASTE|nr:hypothetical protein F0562_011258 [Nyssa sinensis]
MGGVGRGALVKNQIESGACFSVHLADEAEAVNVLDAVLREALNFIEDKTGIGLSTCKCLVDIIAEGLDLL